jgi:hypothetical protein
MKYKPEPIDTSKVALSSDIRVLSELLSQNVHEVWSTRKLREGYAYGAKDDTTAKTHHNLVPYEQLSPEDQAYDRDTALETIKVLITLGFTIEKKDA